MLEALLIIGIALGLLGAFTLRRYLDQAEKDRKALVQKLHRLSHIELKLHHIGLILEQRPTNFPPTLLETDIPCDLEPVEVADNEPIAVPRPTRPMQPAQSSEPSEPPRIAHFPRRRTRGIVLTNKTVCDTIETDGVES